jgi:hypothetical protein
MFPHSKLNDAEPLDEVAAEVVVAEQDELDDERQEQDDDCDGGHLSRRQSSCKDRPENDAWSESVSTETQTRGGEQREKQEKGSQRTGRTQ